MDRVPIGFEMGSPDSYGQRMSGAVDLRLATGSRRASVAAKQSTESLGLDDLTLDELKQLNAANWWPYHGPEDLDSRESRSEDEFPFRKHKLTPRC